jgi:plasmid stabilization system protein ParE
MSITLPNEMAEAVRTKVRAWPRNKRRDDASPGRLQPRGAGSARRDDVRSGLRTTHHRKRTVIAFAVEDDVATILGVFHGGRDYESRLSDDQRDDKGQRRHRMPLMSATFVSAGLAREVATDAAYRGSSTGVRVGTTSHSSGLWIHNPDDLAGVPGGP